MVSQIDPTSQSNRQFHDVLKERREHLVNELKGLSRRKLEIDATIEQLGRDLSHIEALLGEPPSQAPEIPTPDDIADLVVALLAETGRPMHYREIEEALRRQGKTAGEGKDPANALLARYFKDERLYRPARGTYAIRPKGSIKSVGSRRKGRKTK